MKLFTSFCFLQEYDKKMNVTKMDAIQYFNIFIIFKSSCKENNFFWEKHQGIVTQL